MLDLTFQNLLSPMVLFFILGVVAALARSDLSIPEPVAKLLALYLLMSIGFRGGGEVAHQGVDGTMIAAIAAGVALSFALPFVAYLILRTTSRLDAVNAAAVAAHYGSISAVTLVAVTGMLGQLGIAWDGYMIAVGAAMETPAIAAALLIARGSTTAVTPDQSRGALLREVALNGSIVILLGAFVIGALTGARGAAMVKPFLSDPFAGVLCLFLLDMGLVAGRGLAQGRRHLSLPVTGFGVAMPLIGGTFGAALGWLIGLSAGSTAVLITLAASASYIAVPAAMRLALPQANPAVALTLSLGITFPFNLLAGIPLYIAAASRIAP